MSDLAQWIYDFSTGLQTRPVWLLALFAAPLLALAWRRQVYPSIVLVLLAIAPCVLSLAVLLRSDMIVLALCVDLALLAIGAIDLLTLPAAKAFSASRSTLRVASLDTAHAVSITVTNHSRRGWRGWLRDDTPQEVDALPEQLSLRLRPRSRMTVNYKFRARRRGAFEWNCVHLQVRSRFGLWRRFFKCPAHSVVHVYPDMNQLAKYALLARTNRLSLMGVRRARRIGQDHEFERLRDYTQDDNYKHIDWRATARRNRLTVKDFQTSQSQRIIFMIDCGRMMTNESSGKSLLDHSFNAMLMLSYVALRQGDSVGLICFSDRIHSSLPARGGMSQMNHLLHATFDRFPQLVESRYDHAFMHLAARCNKRSLVVLMSNLIDEVNANQLEQYLCRLVGRHLPLGVLMRDRQLFSAADAPPVDDDTLYRAAAAAEILTWRHQVLAGLEQRGVLSLDVFPEDMTAPLVNRYLEIKARHLL